MEIRVGEEESEALQKRKKISEIPKEDRKDFVDRLREVSRRTYVKDREPKILRNIQEEVADNEALFGDIPLGRVERQTNEVQKKKFYRLRNKHNGILTRFLKVM